MHVRTEHGENLEYLGGNQVGTRTNPTYIFENVDMERLPNDNMDKVQD